MGLGTIIGIILGIGAVLGGFIMEGGHPTSLIEPSAFVIVFGGSLGATMVSFALKNAISLPVIMKQAFFPKATDRLDMLKIIVGYAKKARQAGILALESDVKSTSNAFLRYAVQMVVDGTPPELVREILDTEIAGVRARHNLGADFFNKWGGYAPTLGVLGTVMGLVHMLENLSDPGAMGPSIAVAFIATFYGVAFANLALLPIGAKLKLLSHEETQTYEMAVEGILALQAGDNPRVVSSKMSAFLHPTAKKALAESEEG